MKDFKVLAEYDQCGLFDPLAVDERLILLGSVEPRGRLLYRVVFEVPVRLTEDGELEIEYDEARRPIAVWHRGQAVPFHVERVE